MATREELDAAIASKQQTAAPKPIIATRADIDRAIERKRTLALTDVSGIEESILAFGASVFNKLKDIGRNIEQNVSKPIESQEQQAQRSTEIQSAAQADQETLQQQFPNNQIATTLGNVAPDIVAAVALPGGLLTKGAGIARNLATLGKTAGGAGLVGSLGTPEPGQTKAQQFIEGAITGAGTTLGVSAAVPVIVKTAGAVRGLLSGSKQVAKNLLPKTEQQAKDLVINQIKIANESGDAAAAQSARDAATRLRTSLTPGEATRSPLLNTITKEIITQEKGQARILKFVGDRDKQLRGQLDEVIDSVAREGDDALKVVTKSSYDAALPTVLPDEVVDDILSSTIVKNRFNNLIQDEKFIDELAGVDKNSIRYFDIIKRKLDTEIRTASVTAPGDKRALEKARALMVKKLDDVSPIYSVGRKAAERLKVKQEMVDLMKGAPLTEGLSDPSLTAIFRHAFGTQAKQQQFIDTITRLGGNTQQAKDVINIMGLIKGSGITKTLTRTQKTRAETFGGSNITKVIEEVRRNTSGKFEDTLLELMLNPKYLKSVSKANKGTSKNRTESLMALLLRASAGKVPAVSAVNPSSNSQINN